MSGGPSIEASGVTVRFGDVLALDDVSFDLPAGSFLSIIGPNGAGKTTLLAVVLGLVKPSSGYVNVQGEAPDAFPSESVGYVPQVKTLDRTFPARALELVATGLRQSWPWRLTGKEKGQSLAALEKTGVAHLADRPVSALSGGELQRVYLARGLVRRPSLMVLDEPSTGLDTPGEAEMYHMLEDYRADSGATVMMITHDWEGARAHSTHVLVLGRGPVAFGPPGEVADEQRLLAAFGHSGHVNLSHGSAPDV